MVVGHTLDALLAAAVRSEPALVAYWSVRGFTAPLFLMAAGWAAAVAASRRRAGGIAPWRGRVPRVLLLLAVGYALRWPGWGLDRLRAGDPAVWAHLLAFDALHAVALSLLAATVILGLSWTAREKAGALATLAVLTVALGVGGVAPLVPDPSALPGPRLGMALAQAVGGTSPFPLIPWAAYLFAGAIVGLLGAATGRTAVALGGAGAVAVLASSWASAGGVSSSAPGLVALRIGVVLLLFAALFAVPARVAAALAPLGRASLGVYAIHVAMVYGWSTHEGLAQRVGPVLQLREALAVAIAVLAASLLAHHAISAALRGGAGAARLLRARLSVASSRG
jgi:acyltransferase